MMEIRAEASGSVLDRTGLDLVLGALVHALDIRFDLGLLDPPLAAPSDLDGAEIAGATRARACAIETLSSSATSVSGRKRLSTAMRCLLPFQMSICHQMSICLLVHLAKNLALASFDAQYYH